MNKIDWARDWSSFELSITTYCQAKCPLCARTDRNTGGLIDYIELQHSNIDTILKTIRDVAQYTSVRKIQICGDYGDPLMHPNIEDIINEVNSHDLLASIHTNGGLRNKDFYERVAKTNTVLIFGIDGMDEPTNSKYRIGVNFDKAIENMLTYANATQGRNKTLWDFLIFDFNYYQMDDAVRLAKENDIELNFRINTREWVHKITDKSLIEKINSKYPERML